MFCFQIQESLSWGPALHGHGTASSPKLSWDAFSQQFLSETFSMAERISNGVKNEHTHQCRRKGASPASLPAIPPWRSRHLRCRVPGTAPSCGACWLVQAGWSLRRAVRGGGPVVGDIALAVMERRESIVKRQPLQYPVKPLWDVPAWELQLWERLPPLYWHFGVSPRGPAPSQHVVKCFPSANHPSNTGLPYTSC